MEAERIGHAFAPVYDEHSRVLVLGTMPSPASRVNGFYYSHPRNRFWPVAARVFGVPRPVTPEEKRAFLLAHGIAMWDVLAACTIVGADDSSIRSPVANDLRPLLAAAPIRAILTTGSKAHALYQRLCKPLTGLEDIPLPSTSPANARMGLDELAQAYGLLRVLTEDGAGMAGSTNV